MQGGGQQHAGRADPRQRGQIGRPAHAARREIAFFQRARAQCSQTFEVRPLAAAHPLQRHDDDLMRPESGFRQQFRRPEESVAAKIQRKDAIHRRYFDRRVQTFAAQHRAARFGRPGGNGRAVAQARIHPELQLGMGGTKQGDFTAMVAPPQNRIQVGDVALPKRIQTQQPVEDVRRSARPTQDGIGQRTIFVAPAFPGTHHLAGHQVKHGNEP